jgi:hypothetical protein
MGDITTPATAAGVAAPSLLLLFIAHLGPELGPIALIAFAAAAGSLLPLMKRREGSRWDGIVYVATAVFLALVFVGPVAWACEKYFEVPASIALAPLAAVVGIYRDQLLEMLGNLVGGLPAVLSRGKPSAGGGRSGQ